MSEPRYAIPDNGDVLYAEDLHAHTGFILFRAGQAQRGVWGFYRPRDAKGRPSTSRNLNKAEVRGGRVILRDVALLTPDGTALRTEEDLSAPIPSRADIVTLAWKLPAHAKDSDGRIGLDLKVTADEPAPGATTIARIEGRPPVVTLVAPTLSLDATAALGTAAQAVHDALDPLARLLESSPTEPRWIKLCVRRILDESRCLPFDSDPKLVTGAMASGLQALADMAELHAELPAVKEETRALLDRARNARDAVEQGAGALETTLKLLAQAIERECGELNRWLSSRRETLSPVDEIIEAGRWKVWSFALPGTLHGPVKLILERPDGGPMILAWAQIDKEKWTKLHDHDAVSHSPSGGLEIGLENIPAKSRFLNVKADVDVQVKAVHENGSMRT